MATHKQRWISTSTIAIAVAAFVALNVVAGLVLLGNRIDLTENRLYTLSGGTLDLLDTLKEPVRLRFFYSEAALNGYPELQSHAGRIKGLLKEYAARSHGKLAVEVIDPKPFSEEEDLAVSLGVQGIPLTEAGEKLYFGLAGTNSTDRASAIAFFDPDRKAWLEYDLTRLIYDLSILKKPVVGLMTWLPMYGAGSVETGLQPRWVITDLIGESFEMEDLTTGEKKIPDHIGVLMLVHPAAVSDDTLYAIDQFVMRGGRLLVLTDPFSSVPGYRFHESNLTKLYKAWGVEMPADKVVADRTMAIRVMNQIGESSLGTIANITWLGLGPESVNADDVTTAQTELIRLIAPGYFRLTGENPDMKLIPLISGSDDAMLIESFRLMFNDDPLEYLQDYKPAGERYPLAVRLEGKVKSAFPDRKDKGHLAESKEPLHAVLVADADMLRDGFWVVRQNMFGQGQDLLTPTAHNGIFILNALDSLSGGGKLIGLRSRAAPERPFEAVERLRQEAEARFRAQEVALTDKLKKLEEKLQQAGQGDIAKEGILLTPAQEEEIEQFRKQMVETRQELRAVQRSLREEIERLGARLRLVNIVAMPLLLIALAFFVPMRLGRRKK